MDYMSMMRDSKLHYGTLHKMPREEIDEMVAIVAEAHPQSSTARCRECVRRLPVEVFDDVRREAQRRLAKRYDHLFPSKIVPVVEKVDGLIRFSRASGVEQRLLGKAIRDECRRRKWQPRGKVPHILREMTEEEYESLKCSGREWIAAVDRYARKGKGIA